MISYKICVSYDDLAIKRLRYIMIDIDESIVDRYSNIGSNEQYTLFFNEKYGVTLLLYKLRDDKNWVALFKTNYTRREYLYCLLAARVICKNIMVIVNDVDNTSILNEANLLNEAEFKLKLISSNRFAAISRGGDDIVDSLPKDLGCFIIEEEKRVPLVIKKRKNDYKYT